MLPGELLPLHVFEPRYRSMLEVARKSDRIIAIATLMPGFEGCDSCHQYAHDEWLSRISRLALGPP